MENLHSTAQEAKLPDHNESESGETKSELSITAHRSFSVMPPTFPHAVFTPEDCLAVGGQFYTAGLLGQTIEGLKIQEDYPEISNEDLSDSVYRTLGRIVRECYDVTTSVEKAHITSSL